jgi:hypothetical protein
MNSLSPSRTVAANVRAELARLGENMQWLSEGLKQNRVTVGRRLAGNSPFTIDELFAYATVLRVPVATLLQGIESEQASA